MAMDRPMASFTSPILLGSLKRPFLMLVSMEPTCQTSETEPIAFNMIKMQGKCRGLSGLISSLTPISMFGEGSEESLQSWLI
jgi:hypothetical protein